ncbi:hypothetical protein [Streptomyces sp. DH12]|nr:hypothetical protein [Streptomyces sp. DH12]
MSTPKTTPVTEDKNATAAQLLGRAKADRAEQVANETARGQR